MELISKKSVTTDVPALVKLLQRMNSRLIENEADKGDWITWSHIIPTEEIISRVEKNLIEYSETNDDAYLADAANNIMFLVEKGRLNSWHSSK